MNKIYDLYNFCKGCKKKFPKTAVFCDEIGCHRKLSTHAKGYARKVEIARIM